MAILRQIVRLIDGFNFYTGKILAWILVLLMGLSVFEVFTRRVLGMPTIWTHEVLAYVFCAHLMLLLGYTYLYREHVNVDLVTERLSERGQALLEILGIALFLGLFLWVLIPEAIAFAGRAWQYRERAATAFASPVYPAKTLIPVGLILLALEAVSIVLKDVIFLVTGEKVKSRAPVA